MSNHAREELVLNDVIEHRSVNFRVRPIDRNLIGTRINQNIDDTWEAQQPRRRSFAAMTMIDFNPGDGLDVDKCRS